jgi:citrate synthase
VTEAVFSTDLAGVEVGETRISNVDGANGRLSYRGHDIRDLAERPFLQVVWLLLTGTEATLQQEIDLQKYVAVHSCLDKRDIALLKQLPASLHPMLMLQSLVPTLQPDAAPETRINGLPESALTGLIIASKIPSLIAAKRQLELGQDPIKPNIHLTFHENFLTMFTGRAPTAEQLRVLDITQILQLEHSFNASTFAGRVCASTLAPIQSCVTAAIATLFGKLHGGADEAALEMARSVGAADLAAAFVADVLQSKGKIMGMGHREYRVVDPRATILKPIAADLCREGESKQLFDTLTAIEAACQAEFAKTGKRIHANVEFYKGAVFDQLGIPAHYFTSVFAMARVFGYVAHYIEFSENSKLIRPSARYVGN